MYVFGCGKVHDGNVVGAHESTQEYTHTHSYLYAFRRVKNVDSVYI